MAEDITAATAAAEAGLVAALLTSQPSSFGWAAGKASPQLAALSVTSKAALCRTLHKRAVATSGSLTGPTAEADLLVVEDVLLGTRGVELTELKLRLDAMEDGWLLHDLQHLCGAIFSLPPAPLLPTAGVAGAPAAGAAPEPRSRDRGARLLRHFRAEGVVALQTWHEARRAEHRARLEAAGFAPADAARIAARGLPQPSWPIKIFSDFDDTMCAKLLDWSFPGSVPYPGVAAFLRALRGDAPAALASESRSASSGSADAAGEDAGNAASSEPATPSAASARGGFGSSDAGDTPSAAAGGGGPAAGGDAADIADGSLLVRTRKRDRIRALFSGLFGGSTPAAAGAASPSTGAGAGAGAGSPRSSPADAVPLDSDDAPIASHGLPATVSLEPGALAPTMLALDAPSGAAGAAAADAEAGLDTGASGGAGAAPAAAHEASTTRRQCSDACLNSRIGHPGVSGVVYISARPGLLKEKTRRATTALLGAPPQAILVGSFSKLLTNAGMAERKLENYASYRVLFPEFAVVWLGDSGQGDIEVAKGMLAAHEADEREAAAAAAAATSSAGKPASSPSTSAAAAADGAEPGSAGAAAMPEPDAAAALPDADAEGASPPAIRWWPPPKPLCLIHDLCTRDQKKFNEEGKRSELAAAGIHLFDSYVEAATVAFERGCVSESALMHVVQAATADMRATLFNSAPQRDGRVADFRAAVRRARDAMAAHDESKCWAAV